MAMVEKIAGDSIRTIQAGCRLSCQIMESQRLVQTRSVRRRGCAIILPYHMQAQVESGGRTGGGQDPAVVYIQGIGINQDQRVTPR